LFEGFNKRLKAEVENFNAYCKGTFPKGEYEKRKAWCDENEIRLAGDQKQSKEIGKAIVNRLQDLEDRKKKLSEDTLNWFSRKKELNGQWEDWQTAQQNWMARYAGAEMSGLRADLLKRTGAISDCENTSTLEAAHRCLQLLWNSVEKIKQRNRKGTKSDAG